MMKYFQLLLLWVSAFSALPIIAYSETTKVVTLNFDYTDFQFETIDGCVQISSDKYNLFFREDTLAPALPYICINVLIGPYQEYQSFTYTTQSGTITNNINFLPNPTPIPTDVDTREVQVTTVNFPKSVYPTHYVEYNGKNTIDGYKYVSFIVCPFQYYAKLKKLRIKSQITITMQLSSTSVGGNHFPIMPQNNLRTKQILCDNIINANEIDNLYWGYHVPMDTPQDTSPYKYIIITSNSFASSFQPLADWKTIKGCRAKVVTIENILNNYSTGDTIQRIKRAIIDLRNDGAEYILLGGFPNIVPSAICSYNGQSHTSDLYYSALETMDWDTNQNGIIGDSQDEISLIPQIIVSRALVKNSQDIKTFAGRIINNDLKSISTIQNNNFLLAGYILYNLFPYNGFNISDARYFSERIFAEYIHPYGNFYRYGLYDTIEPSNSEMSLLTTTNLQNELAKGYPSFFMNTHGVPHRWAIYKDSISNELTYYDSTMASGLNNNGHTLIVTSACETNRFDNYSDTLNPSLNYCFMSNTKSGIIGYIGCSEKGYTSYSPKEMGISDLLNALFYSELLSDKSRCIGKAIMKAKANFAFNQETQSHMRNLMFWVNYIGDPETSLNLSTPNYFTNVTYISTNDSIFIDTGIDSCTICVTSANDCGFSYFHCKKNVRTVCFDQLPNDYRICIIKPEYIPYIILKTTNAKIQNETIKGDYTIYANNISIGENIDSTKPFGPISIEGHMKVQISDEMLIKNSFEIQSGKSFEVTIPSL